MEQKARKKAARISWLAAVIILQSLFSGCSLSRHSMPYVLEDQRLALVETNKEAVAIRRSIVIKNPEDAEPLCRNAEALLQKGELEKARVNIERALTLNPLSEQCLLSAGRIYYRSGDYFKAIKHLSGSLALDEKLLPAYYLLALSYAKTGKVDQAVNRLESAIKIEPLFFDARLELISIQSELNPEPDNLIFLVAKLKDLMKLHPASTRGPLLLSEIYSRLGESYKAAAVLEKRLDKHGNNDRILSALARIKYRAGQPREALRILRKQRQSDVNSKILRLKIKSRSSPKQAEKEAEQLLKAFPYSEDVLIFYAELKLKRGKTVRAERAVRKILNANPNNAEAYHCLARILRARNDRAGANWAFAKAFRAAPENQTMMADYLQQLLKNGRWEKADEILSGHSSDSRLPEILSIRGFIAGKKENCEQAEKLLLEAARQKYSALTEARLADVEVACGKPGRARKRLKRANRIFPGNIEIALSKAGLLLKTRKANKVPVLLRPFLKHPDGQGKVHVLLAEALAGANKIKEAALIMERAFKRWPENTDVVLNSAFYLGLDKQYRKVVKILEKNRPFKGRNKLLLGNQLKYFYFKSGNLKKFQNEYPSRF